MKILNNVVSIFVILIIIIIIIPLNTFLVDLLLVVNVSISLIIILSTMYIKETLEFSVFPSVLLITTLFRLSLNLSTTKLILGNSGNAGDVIKTFGEFVIGSNPVVGFVVFLLIVAVQFLVITKGSERVAEVAARFTLDAMPGKQMAIDADLSAGLISEEEARERRSKIQREAAFYGSMDGATKFVKGDAIMSIATTVVNLIGGVIVGVVMDGGDFNSVLYTYSIATVGDGLISQIPALLISTATGIIVTRSASQDTLNEDFRRQFLSQPVALIIAGIVVAMLTLIPGFPPVQLLVMGGVLVTAGVLAIRKQNESAALAQQAQMEALPATQQESGGVGQDVDYYKNIDNVFKLLPVEQIEMEFGYSIVPLVSESSGGSFIERLVIFRKQYALEMGMVIPSVRMRENIQLNPNQYVIKIKGEEIARADVLVDHLLAIDPGGVYPEIEGIETLEPAFGIPAKWISEDKRIVADVAGYTLIDPTSVIITHLSEVTKRHSYELISREDVKSMVETVKLHNPSIVEESVPGVVSISLLQKILQLLLIEQIPIRDMESILETLGEYAQTIKDTDILTEYVRQALKRTVTRKFSEAGQLRVLTLDSDIENIIMNSVKKSDQGSYLTIEPDMIQAIMGSLGEQIEKVSSIIPMPIVLTSPVVRIYFKKLVDQFIPNVIVLSFSEIEGSVQIQALGNVSLPVGVSSI